MKNKDIRAYASKKGVYLWQIAESLGIADSNFSRKLRKELPEESKKKIFKIIDNLAVEK
ncbi:hypothetical protein [Blautia sp.]|uniref:hypothetical protein n=1 Tax=Blautia sp. TaxID=1955243 RepID=UPI003AB6CD16